MQKQYDVTALGELLIDFTENGVSEQGNALLEAYRFYRESWKRSIWQIVKGNH